MPALYAFAALALFGFFFTTINLLLNPPSSLAARRIRQVKRLGLTPEELAVQDQPLLLRLTQPIIQILNSRCQTAAGSLNQLSLRLEQAGLFMSPQQFTALRILLTLAVGIFWGLIALVKQQSSTTLVWLSATVVVYFLPEALLRAKLQNNQEKLMKEFPDFIDATRTYLSSGMSIYQTIKHAAEIAGPGMKHLLVKLSAELEVYDHATALRKFADRSGSLEVQNFIITIEQGINAGISLKDIFLSQSQLMRELRKLTLRKQIKKKPTYMALVGGLLFINIFIIVGLPAAYSIMALRGIN